MHAGGFSLNMFGSLLLIAVTSVPAMGQLPTVRLEGVFPAGGAPGKTVEVTISGNDLDDVDRLFFGHPGITAERKMAEPTPFDDGPQPVENVFVVKIAAEVPPGQYDVRCHGRYGRSNRRIFEVGAFPELIETEPNGGNDIPAWVTKDGVRTNPAVELTLPVIVNGQSTGGPDVDWFRFRAKAGERLMFDAYTRRIDSRMDPMLTLLSESGQIIAESAPGDARDALADVRIPTDGEYYIRIHDTLYAQGPGYVYRLMIASRPQLDFIFPPAGTPGSNEEYTVYGRNLPSGVPSPFQVNGITLEQTRVRIPIPADLSGRLDYRSVIGPHQAGMDGFEFRIENQGAASNPVLITPLTAPAVLETENSDPAAPQRLSPPCEVMGQFYPQRDADWYLFEAKQDEVWIVEILSHRLGTQADPSLLIQQMVTSEQGEVTWKDVVFLDDVQERNFNNRSGRHEFDERTSDPVYPFRAPADGQYRVMVRDALSAVKSDPRLVYRLAIRKPQPDFRIVAIPGGSAEALMLRKGGRDVIRVVVWRIDGYDGEIRVSVSGLPNGVTSDEITIGPGNEYGTLVLTASDAASGVSPVQVVAKAVVAGAEVTRPARYGAAVMSFQFNQPNANVASVPSRLVNSIEVSVSESEAAPQTLTIGHGDGRVLETARGGILKIPYSVRRAEGSAGNLIGFPMDFPPNTNAQQVNINNAEKGEFELRFQTATIPGTYSIYLAGFNQGLQYRRNPELAERAKTRQERVAAILTEAQKKTQECTQESQKTQTELNQANTALTQATSARQQAEQKANAARTALEQAELSLRQKMEQSAASPDDAALKMVVTQATEVRDAAKKAADDTKVAFETASKAMEDAATAKTTAEANRKTAQDNLQAAQQFQQRAQQEKQRADQFAAQKQNESNVRGINANVPSNSILIRVHEFPVKLESFPDQLTVRQGEKAELSLRVSRQFEFMSQITMQLQPPRGVNGLSFPGLTIPDNQTEAKVEMMAQANAPVGEHLCTARVQMNFNGQNLILERPVKITVNAAAPAP